MLKKYTFTDTNGKKYTYQATSLSDALSKHNNINDAYVEEWWGQTDESPVEVAKRYNLKLTKLSRKGDETLYRFTGSNTDIKRAMDEGYFYSVENEAGKYVKDSYEISTSNLSVGKEYTLAKDLMYGRLDDLFDELDFDDEEDEDAFIADLKRAGASIRGQNVYFPTGTRFKVKTTHGQVIVTIKGTDFYFGDLTVNIKDCITKDEDVEYLSNEEKQAIEDYKKAIQNTTDLKLLRLYAHILQEEIEHLEELETEK